MCGHGRVRQPTHRSGQIPCPELCAMAPLDAGRSAFGETTQLPIDNASSPYVSPRSEYRQSYQSCRTKSLSGRSFTCHASTPPRYQ